MKKVNLQKLLSEYFDSYQIDQILQKITGFTKNQLFFCDKIETVSDLEIKNIIELHKSWTPFEYIIQKAEFYGLDFYVDNRVLIPRNDTEIMVEIVLNSLKYSKNLGPVLMDIWTGSSCIPLSILENIDSKNITTHVVDISTDALEVSKINIHHHKKEVQQHNWSLYSPLEDIDFSKNDVYITANLPYIKDNDHDNMSVETIVHEPSLALYWWKDTGFELYEQLITQIIQQIKKGFLKSVQLYIEIWFDQKEYSENYLKNLNLDFQIHKDNSWIHRCIQIGFDSYLK